MDTIEVLGQAYRPRVIDAGLRRALGAAGAVVVEGARASGKTMTALHAAGSYAFIDDPATQRILEIAPHRSCTWSTPRSLQRRWALGPSGCSATSKLSACFSRVR